MASFVLRRASGRLTAKTPQRWASAAAVPLTERPPYYEETDSDRKKTPEPVKVSKLSNGVTVASQETHSHSTSLSLYVRAGSRFEMYHQQGLTHLLRNTAYLAAGGRSTFRVTREIDNVGGSLSATNTREHMVYRAHLLRGNEDLALDILSKAVVSPDLRHWEIQDLTAQIDRQVTEHERDPDSCVVEALHRGAFRNALSNPLYSPRFNVGHITSNDLRGYMDDWFVGRRTTLVGIGVDHQELMSMAESSFSPLKGGLSRDGEETSHYYGGLEIYLPSRSSHTHASIVSKGASLASEQDLMSAGVLQHLMGCGEAVKWGSSLSRIVKAGLNTTDTPFNAHTLNMNYSDNGLFGFCVTSEPQDIGKLLQAVMHEFSSVAKGDVSEAELARAKNQLKARHLMSAEQTACLSDDIATQVSMRGDYSPLLDQKVDSVTKDNVVQFAKAVFGARSTFVAHGDLSSTPHMQQLLEGVSLR